MANFKESEVCGLLKTCPDKRTAGLATDTSLVKSLTAVFNATLEIAADPPKSRFELGTALSQKAVALSGVAETATGSTGLRAANFVATQALKTIGLAKMANYSSPAKASIYLTLVMTEKIVSAAGMANFDKCRMAVASLSATAGMGAFACFSTGAFTMGMGCVVGAIAVAGDAFDAYGQCYGTPSGGAANATPLLSGRMP